MIQLKPPKNDGKLFWTKHVLEKMKFYRLSETRLKNVLRRPTRMEKGIAPRTIAIMQPTASQKRPTEIWLMYQERDAQKRIITAWRYPGKSPVREQIPIPKDILKDLDKILE